MSAENGEGVKKITDVILDNPNFANLSPEEIDNEIVSILGS